MKMKSGVFFLLVPLVTLSGSSFALTTPANSGNAKMNQPNRSANDSLSPDNTGINESDRQTNELAKPVDAKLNQRDQKKINAKDTSVSAQIKQQIINGKSASSSAQNVKVITRNGKVTLRGSLRSEAERDQILKQARDVAGASNVTDEMTIAPSAAN